MLIGAVWKDLGALVEAQHPCFCFPLLGFLSPLSEDSNYLLLCIVLGRHFQLLVELCYIHEETRASGASSLARLGRKKIKQLSVPLATY